MTIGICDDELYECERIKEFVSGLSDVDGQNVFMYSPDQLNRSMVTFESNNETNSESVQTAGIVGNLDIAILDIEFKNKDYNGIELAKKINDINNDCQIIYLTHVLEFAPEVYETKHCYFVLKNNMEVMLPKALEKAQRLQCEKILERPIEVMSNGHKVYIKESEVLFVEKEQRQTVIHTANNKYPCYESVSALVKRFSDNVIRCHGGYLVNLSHVTYLGADNILLDHENLELPLGKTYKEQTKQAYLRYWMKRM